MGSELEKDGPKFGFHRYIDISQKADFINLSNQSYVRRQSSSRQ